MSRLIDADALMEYVLNLKDKRIGCNDIARFPTAYDIDKVIEELEELKDEEIRTSGLTSAYVQICNAIEIVKRGGAE